MKHTHFHCSAAARLLCHRRRARATWGFAWDVFHFGGKVQFLVQNLPLLHKGKFGEPNFRRRISVPSNWDRERLCDVSLENNQGLPEDLNAPVGGFPSIMLK
jgi:hypothetical protein